MPKNQTSRIRLFEPIKLGNMELKHRRVLGSSTKRGADPDANLSVFTSEYQKIAQYPETLSIAEAIPVHFKLVSPFTVPHLHNKAQITKWNKVFVAAYF